MYPADRGFFSYRFQSIGVDVNGPSGENIDVLFCFEDRYGHRISTAKSLSSFAKVGKDKNGWRSYGVSYANFGLDVQNMILLRTTFILRGSNTPRTAIIGHTVFKQANQNFEPADVLTSQVNCSLSTSCPSDSIFAD